MPWELTPTDQAALQNIVSALENAWNSMDGSAFAAPFAADSDFVNIRGEHMRGRDTIGAGHAAIFRTIYAGSRNHYTVESVRLLRPDVVLMHVRALLNAPQGPLLGQHGSCFSIILTKEAGDWEIAAFHNTLEAAPTR